MGLSGTEGPSSAQRSAEQASAQRCTVADLQIRRDISRLVIPLIDLRLIERTLTFSIEPNTPPFTRRYSFVITFPNEYPFASPRLLCTTPGVFHPNIDEMGNVCLKVLREGWRPTFDLNSVVVSLVSAFEDPSGEDALNTEAGRLVEEDWAEFVARVKQQENP